MARLLRIEGDKTIYVINPDNVTYMIAHKHFHEYVTEVHGDPETVSPQSPFADASLERDVAVDPRGYVRVRFGQITRERAACEHDREGPCACEVERKPLRDRMALRRADRVRDRHDDAR